MPLYIIILLYHHVRHTINHGGAAPVKFHVISHHIRSHLFFCHQMYFLCRLNSSRSSSALGLGTTPCGARKNPFDDMPPFNPKGSAQTNLINQNQSSTCLPNEGQFAIRDTMSSQGGRLSINIWLNLHSSHGKKITQDRMKWLSRNKIIDLWNAKN